MTGLAHRGRAAAALGLVAGVCAMGGPASAHHRPCHDCAIPFQWDDGAAAAPVVGPFPEGFALTVPVTVGQSGPAPSLTLDRYVEVAAALGRCWSPGLAPADSHWRDLTLRLSFRRDGTVNGVPRVVHVSDPADADAPIRARASVLAALNRCTPLPLSPSLGRAIAGQIFAIRFVQQRNS